VLLVIDDVYGVLMADKLNGLYLTTSHAVKINSAVTFEIVPIMTHDNRVESTRSVQASDVHYLWVFGDEASQNFFVLIILISLQVRNCVDHYKANLSLFLLVFVCRPMMLAKCHTVVIIIIIVVYFY